jgi:O-antigen/teichoic acid export membrane protein
MAGLQVVAIYSLSYKFAASVDILVTRPFALDWAARRFSIATGNHPEQEYAKAAILYAFIALWCALLVQAGTPLLYDLFASSLYIQGLNALPVLLAANVILGLSYPLNVGIMLKDRTKLLLPITAMAGISYILALYFLIPHNPIQGAAWATLMAYSVHTSGITLVSLRLYPVKYPFQDWLLLGACSILAAAGLYLLNIDASPWAEALARGLWISLIFTLTGYFFWKCRSVLASAESTPSSK